MRDLQRLQQLREELETLVTWTVYHPGRPMPPPNVLRYEHIAEEIRAIEDRRIEAIGR